MSRSHVYRRSSVAGKTAFLLALPLLASALTAADYTVTVARDISSGSSSFETGVTFTQDTLRSWDDATAKATAETYLGSATDYYNQHIMGFGAGNPQPWPGGAIDFTSLDERLGVANSITLPGGHTRKLVITFCGCPDWMTVDDGSHDGDSFVVPIKTAPTVNHFDEYAALCAAIADRYDGTNGHPLVQYFQVWNELAGFWDGPNNTWDMPRYTDMYNQIYNAVKAVRSDANIGGPYITIEGTGSLKGGWAAALPISSRQQANLQYWLQNKVGAQFISVQHNTKDAHDANTYTDEELLSYTPQFGSINDQLNSMMDTYNGGTRLPIWYSEYYGSRYTTDDYTGSMYSSIYLNLVKSGAKVALLWGPEELAIPHYLFTETNAPTGGQPVEPHASIFKFMHDNFATGTAFYADTSSSTYLEALVSADKTMLVHKRNATKTVSIFGTTVTLAPYEVAFLDNPPYAKNPSITTSDGGTGAQYWTLKTTASGSPTYLRDTVTYHDSPASLSVKSPAGAVADGSYGQRFNVKPNSTFVVTGWARANGTSITKKRVILKVRDAGGAQVQWTSLYTITADNAWHSFSYTITTPATAVDAELRLEYAGKGQAWLDQVSINLP